MPPRSIHSATPLAELPGVGPERAALLGRLKRLTVQDLLFHRPRRYEDRRQVQRIADLETGSAGTVRGHVRALGLRQLRRSRQTLFELILEDGSARLHCRWWNLPFMQNYFRQGDEVFAHGRLNSLKPRTMDHPETEVLETGEESSIHLNRITPIYPLTEGLPQRWLRALLWRLLHEWQPPLEEPFPDLDRGDLPRREEAFRMIHFPDSFDHLEAGRQRLALDEFLDLQLHLRQRRQRLMTGAKGLPCGGDNRWIKPFLAQVGFPLTQAQTRVLRDIRQDLSGQHPMRRLIQGDVGAGKTVVAACAGLMTLESGFNVILMAPTEILAEQHYKTFQDWLHPLGLKVELQTGSRKTLLLPGSPDVSPPSSTRSLSPPSDLDPFLVVGTHALIEQSFALPKLGLVIIDEQHKFGVSQRESLVRKGQYPHLLVMTATPIPRSLALTLYGDLDASVIDELPAGRGALQTHLRTPDALDKVLAFMRRQLEEGRQAYVVYPRVEEADPKQKSALKAVTKEFQKLKKLLAPHEVGLLHGRLKSEEKETIMQAFRAGSIQVLVATTVIEVGLDVPNATVMLVENADQFGLAQLHQLRGRIGRGRHASHCILLADLKTDQARQRLDIMTRSRDGFRIAEADLDQRGPGEMLGREQSGLPPFVFGNLARDVLLIEQAKQMAVHLL